MLSGSPFDLIEHLRTSNDCGEELRSNKMNDDLLANRIIWHHLTFGISVSVCSSNTPFPPVDNLIILVKFESSGDKPSRYDMCLSTCLFTAMCSACLKWNERQVILSNSWTYCHWAGKKCRDWRKRHQYVSPDFPTGISLHFVTATIHTKIL